MVLIILLALCIVALCALGLNIAQIPRRPKIETAEDIAAYLTAEGFSANVVRARHELEWHIEIHCCRHALSCETREHLQCLASKTFHAENAQVMDRYIA
jgi:hypothetical protein